VAGSLRYADLDEAYVAGLLHDIGKLVLDQYVRVDYHAIVELMKKRQLQLWQVEEQLFGMDHGAVGGLMAANWNFPPALTEAIKCHHWPTLARTRPELAAIINLANALALEQNAGRTALSGGSMHPEGLRLLGLDDQRLARLRASLPTQFGEAEAAATGPRR
jgi:HD-like signal output (HDOD) protein